MRVSMRATAGAAALVGAALGGGPALARALTGFGDGLAAGVAAPVSGIAPFAFAAGVGVAAVVAGLRWSAPFAASAGLILGAAAVMGGSAPAEAMIAGARAVDLLAGASTLILGLLLILPRVLPPGVWPAVLALGGAFQGLAFGAAATGSVGPAAIGLYLGLAAGPAAVGVAIALGLGVKDGNVRSMRARLLGAAIAGAGAAMLAATLDAPLTGAI